MKLKFKKQQFQSDAVAAVVDLFKGQASSVSPFTVGKLDIIDYAQDSVFGYGNTLTLTAEEITRNLHEVQQRNLLPLTEPEQLRFNIEMETGTGKTFVYTKTIYELNKRYGFNKFVILVPSVAIREGAYKSLQITEEYFRQEYDGKRAHFFIYDSKKRNEVRDFALSTNLEIMIVNIDAIKKDENLFNQESDKMDKTAREFMAQCRPILIIDEPQSIDNTDKSRKAAEGGSLSHFVKLCRPRPLHTPSFCPRRRREGNRAADAALSRRGARLPIECFCRCRDSRSPAIERDSCPRKTSAIHRGAARPEYSRDSRRRRGRS